MTKILFEGCSFTHGDGLLDRDLAMPACVARDLLADIDNHAVRGSSNLEIFHRTVRALMSHDYDVAVVQWTSLRRYWFEPSLGEAYLVAGDAREIEHPWTSADTGLHMSRDQRQWLHDTLTLLTGDYKALIDLSTFCRCLQIMAQSRSTHLVMINGLVPWNQDLMIDLDYHDPDSVLSAWTKSLIQWPQSGLEQARDRHTRLRTQWEPLRDQWINQFDSWFQCHMLDQTDRGYHPGPKSHRFMADLVIKYLVDHKLIKAV